MSGIKVYACKAKCKECGFLRDGIQGTLTPDFLDVLRYRKMFPCHLVLKEFSGSENTGTEDYVDATGEIQVCRGYVESLIKSGVPPENSVWDTLYAKVKAEGLSEDTMSIIEAVWYHKDSISKRS